MFNLTVCLPRPLAATVGRGLETTPEAISKLWVGAFQDCAFDARQYPQNAWFVFQNYA
jgi:hypothetical protein